MSDIIRFLGDAARLLDATGVLLVSMAGLYLLAHRQWRRLKGPGRKHRRSHKGQAKAKKEEPKVTR